MQLNTVVPSIFTHEGGKAKRITLEQMLRRSVMACMLWESEFYESGEEIARRIGELVAKCSPKTVRDIAIEARNKMKLRHVPLLLAREMVRLPTHRRFVSSLLSEIIQRPDELCEFLALYWKEGRVPLANQVKLGLAQAFTKFNAYQLGKYNRDKAIKLKDVLFLCHAKPKDADQSETWKALINGTLETPDTWEVALSGGADKKTTFERLIREKKLGALALLRNLRGMTEASVSASIIREGLKNVNAERVLPFRFIAAANHAPRFELELEELMLKCLGSMEKLEGETILLVDVSGSMDAKVSGKSEISRLDAASGVAILLREICECRVFTFSNSLVEVPPRRGFGLKDAIVKSQPHSSTYLGEALKRVTSESHERIIVITDEQSADRIPNPKIENAYMINVASAKNGVGYGPWKHIDGWSECVVDYIRATEQFPQAWREGL